MSIMKNVYKYKIKVEGEANVEYFSDYDGFEFLAFDDEEAISKVERLQKACEEKMLADGVELTPYDPCLMSHIFRVTDEEDILIKR